MFYEAARSANWFVRTARSANTPADRSKRATQLSPWGCSARFVPVVFGPVGRSRTRNGLFGVREGVCDAVHGMRGLVYGTVQKVVMSYMEFSVWCTGI